MVKKRTPEFAKVNLVTMASALRNDAARIRQIEAAEGYSSAARLLAIDAAELAEHVADYIESLKAG